MAKHRYHAPVAPLESTRESLEGMHGFRDSQLDFGKRDWGSAKSLGPKRAARVISPTRDVMRRTMHIRQV